MTVIVMLLLQGKSVRAACTSPTVWLPVEDCNITMGSDNIVSFGVLLTGMSTCSFTMPSLPAKPMED
jgi:hypothetical protein